MKCPHCGWEAKGMRLPALCRHMIENHDGETLRAGDKEPYWTQLCTLQGANWMRCWCGQRVTVERRNEQKHSQWAKHIQEHGGLAGHILEITLGLEEK